MKLNYQRQGNGEPLLLIHGTGSHLQMWEPVIGRLARERDVIAVDLPGHGKSPLVPAGMAPTAATFAVLLTEMLDELGISTAHVAGNSMGGWTALEMAKLGRVRSVVALSPAGLWRQQAPLYDRLFFRWNYALLQLIGGLVQPAVWSALGRVLFLSTTVGRAWQMPARAAQGMIYAFAHTRGFDEHLRAVVRIRFQGGQGISASVPVTVAWGGKDRLLLPWQSRRKDELPQHTRWITLPGCGHVPTYDNPELVARVILSTGRGEMALI
ncbi:MAG: alpha/beta fold hydrolase [Chloroflexota bacterium]